jgi:hypothetical protein
MTLNRESLNIQSTAAESDGIDESADLKRVQISDLQNSFLEYLQACNSAQLSGESSSASPWSTNRSIIALIPSVPSIERESSEMTNPRTQVGPPM